MRSMSKHNELPAPTTERSRSQVIEALEMWKSPFFPDQPEHFPNPLVLGDDWVALTDCILAWGVRHAPNVNLDAVLEAKEAVLQRVRHDHLRSNRPDVAPPWNPTNDELLRAVQHGIGACGRLARHLQASAPVATQETPTGSSIAPAVLPRRLMLAWLSYGAAEHRAGRRLTDGEAYKLLREEGFPDDDPRFGELGDYEPGAFETWSRYLREARKLLGEQKYTPRVGRVTGKSAVRRDQV